MAMASGNRKRKKNKLSPGFEEEHSLRLFIAIDIPPAAVDELISWQDRYLSDEPALRMTPADQLHITLVFIGQVGNRVKELAVEQLDALTLHTAFYVTLSALMGLPNGRSPRVIAARVDEPSGALRAFHDELAAGLVAKRIYKRERRPYLPHVTIARARGRTSIELAAIEPAAIQFTAVRATLYNSILKPSGALHKALKSVQLT